jgi:hypothetical protein
MLTGKDLVIRCMAADRMSFVPTGGGQNRRVHRRPGTQNRVVNVTNTI